MRAPERVLRAVTRQRLGLVAGASIATTLLLAVVLGPALISSSPLQQDLATALLPPGSTTERGLHLLGTDDLGRDMLARTLAGGRIPFLVGFGAVAISGVIGVITGLCAGFFSGATDAVLSRLADIQLSLPNILVALTLLAFTGRNVLMLIAVIAVTGWPSQFRLVRAATLQLRSQPFVEAAIASGQGRLSVIFRHLLPNVRILIVMCATLDFSRALLLQAGLSFLGLGVSPPTPDWGLMVSQGQSQLTFAWWIATFPGLAIVLLVLSVNLIGDWLSTRREVAVTIEQEATA